MKSNCRYRRGARGESTSLIDFDVQITIAEEPLRSSVEFGYRTQNSYNRQLDMVLKGSLRIQSRFRRVNASLFREPSFDSVLVEVRFKVQYFQRRFIESRDGAELFGHFG